MRYSTLAMAGLETTLAGLRRRTLSPVRTAWLLQPTERECVGCILIIQLQ